LREIGLEEATVTLVKQADTHVRFLDTTAIHVEKAVAYATI